MFNCTLGTMHIFKAATVCARVKTLCWVPFLRCGPTGGIQFTVQKTFPIYWPYVSLWFWLVLTFFYAIRYLLCYSWIIKTSPWAGPCSPQKSRVPSASRASCFSWPNWPLWPYQLNILPSWPLTNQTAPEAPPALATVMLLPFLCGAAWSSMVDLVGMSHHRGFEGSLHQRSGRDVGVGRLDSQGVLHQVHPWNISGYDREPQISCLGQYRQLRLLGQSFHSR